MDYTINTPCGVVQGCKCKLDGIVAFKGIRYATAKRFEYPVQVTHWDGVYEALKYKHCAYQPRSFYDEEKNIKKVFYYNEFRKGETYTYSEDCLYLNIWKPESANEDSKLPVIVYIHGGGYTGGCAHEKHFDDPIWPLKNIITVTINYRLGPLGFSCFEEQANNEEFTGNYGLYDQITAIKWVKENITPFGGNPNNITIMGQSAGAMSVQALCLSDYTKGLFHKAVMNSGGGVHSFLSPKAPEKLYPFWNKVMEIAGCKTFDDFKTIPVEKIFEAWTETKKQMKGYVLPTSPVIDGRLISTTGKNVLNNNQQHHIPYMMGSTSEDMMPPLIYKMAYNYCKAQEIPSYCWMFNQQLPGDKNGAWHSSDLWYFFGTLGNSWRPMTEGDYKLSSQMVDYLCNFARTGNPNGEKLPEWKPLTKKQHQVMHFGNDSSTMKKVKVGKLWLNLLTKKQVGE